MVRAFTLRASGMPVTLGRELLVATRNPPMVKIRKLPPGEARGARDLQRWGRLRRYGSYGPNVGVKNWVCRNGHEALRSVNLERCPKCNVLYERRR